jgi:hypothetical protein
MKNKKKYCIIIKQDCQQWFIDMEQLLRDLKIIENKKEMDHLIDGLLQLRHQLWIEKKIDSPKDEAIFKKIANENSEKK